MVGRRLAVLGTLAILIACLSGCSGASSGSAKSAPDDTTYDTGPIVDPGTTPLTDVPVDTEAPTSSPAIEPIDYTSSDGYEYTIAVTSAPELASDTATAPPGEMSVSVNGGSLDVTNNTAGGRSALLPELHFAIVAGFDPTALALPDCLEVCLNYQGQQYIVVRGVVSFPGPGGQYYMASGETDSSQAVLDAFTQRVPEAATPGSPTYWSVELCPGGGEHCRYIAPWTSSDGSDTPAAITARFPVRV